MPGLAGSRQKDAGSRLQPLPARTTGKDKFPMTKTILPHGAEPQTDREYTQMISRQRMLERAANLHNDGYSVFCRTERLNSGFTAAIRGEFVVVTPKGEAYAVNPLEQTCGCVAWKRNQTCKHVAGVLRAGEIQAYDLIRRYPLGNVRHGEGCMLLRAVKECRFILEQRRAAA